MGVSGCGSPAKFKREQEHVRWKQLWRSTKVSTCRICVLKTWGCIPWKSRASLNPHTHLSKRTHSCSMRNFLVGSKIQQPTSMRAYVPLKSQTYVFKMTHSSFMRLFLLAPKHNSQNLWGFSSGSKTKSLVLMWAGVPLKSRSHLSKSSNSNSMRVFPLVPKRRLLTIMRARASLSPHSWFSKWSFQQAMRAFSSVPKPNYQETCRWRCSSGSKKTQARFDMSVCRLQNCSHLCSCGRQCTPD